MKYSALSLLLLSAAGCSAAPSSAPSHALFAGAWTGTQTSTVTCTGSSSTADGVPWSAMFAETPEGVTFTSTPNVAGVEVPCTFAFRCSGDVASLEGAPLVCSVGANLVTYTAISLTSDGAHLSGVVTATVTTTSGTCAVSQAIEAAR